MKPLRTSQCIFCYQAMATSRYIQTAKNRASNAENTSSRLPLTAVNNDIDKDLALTQDAAFTPSARTLYRIPIAIASLLAQTTTQIAAVSYLGA